ncbi:MAG: hypothetical protein KF708_18640 [Pirellulales bacterium]|nr:hypothetical protein [Pirellulales bacterium]
MMRDIEYAALAVRRQIVEKFGAEEDLSKLTVQAGEATIVVAHGAQRVEGTRDNLLAMLRQSTTYGDFLGLGVSVRAR